MLPRVLLVEDDPFVSALSDAFLRQYFSVSVAMSAQEALGILARKNFDLVLLDLGLPDEDGLVLARQMKARNKDLAIIYLTSRDKKEDIIAGLEIGGDDYIVKPFDPDVLLARVSAVLRRTDKVSQPASTISIKVAPDTIDLDMMQRRATIAEKGELILTRAEFDVLLTLAKAEGRVLSRGVILDAISNDPNKDVDERVIDALISKIRRKANTMGLSESPIETVRGLGYRVTRV